MTDEHTAPIWSSTALVTIDLQCDTLDGQPLEIAGTSQVVPRVAALCRAFRMARRPIVHVVRLYQPDGSNADLCRRGAIAAGASYLVPGSDGAQLANGVLPPGRTLDCDTLLEGRAQVVGPCESVVFKSRWGAFYKTPLEKLLLSQGVTTVVFGGCNLPNCPRTSIYEASERDFRVVLAEDGTSGTYERGLDEMESIGVTVASADEVIVRLDNSSRGE